MQIIYYVNGEALLIEGDTTSELLKKIAEVKDNTLYLNEGKVEEEVLCLS